LRMSATSLILATGVGQDSGLWCTSLGPQQEEQALGHEGE
jgi:hypothetical protein